MGEKISTGIEGSKHNHKNIPKIKPLEQTPEYIKLQKEKEGNNKKNKQDIHNTTFERIKKEHALRDLEETNKVYSGEKEGFFGSNIDKIGFYLATLGDVDLSNEDILQNKKNKSKSELRELQEILIGRILGTKQGFNKEELKGFNKEKGNYLIKISDFEKKIEKSNIKNVNSKELESYIKYLVSIDDNYKVRKIISRLEKEGINNDTFFNPIEIYNSDIKEIQNPIFSMIKSVKDKFNGFMDNLLNFDNINNFIEKFEGKSEIEQKEIINNLKDGLENYKQDFIESIQNSLSNDKSKEEKLEIATNFVENLINTPEIGDILKKIKAFEKKEGIHVNEENITKKTITIKKYSKQVEVLEAIKRGDKVSEKKLSAELKVINFNSNTINSLTTYEFNTLSNRLQNGESFDNVIQEISQENEELNKLLEKYEHEKIEDNNENEVDEEKEENNQYYIDDDEFIAGEKTGTYDLSFYDIELGYVNIKGLTKKEKLNTIRNPEGLKNLVNFYKFFKDLNLEGVWKYRKELALSMGSVNININDNDSVSEAELLKFGKKLIQVINSINEENPQVPYKAGYKLSENTGNLNAMKAEIRNYSGANSDLSNEQTYNIKGEDKFTASLRNHGIIGGAYFHTMQLRKLMK